ncbi:MAG: hypothetical protein Q8J78_06765 [Moraxellaceae bacterium]|nr:hypothetical protein [Moraxellaceae bacterium]
MSTDQSSAIATTPNALTVEAAQVIPLQHHEAFYSLSAKERERVSELLNVFTEIDRAGRGIVSGLNRVALANLDRHGWTFHNLRTLFYRWRDGKDWRVLARCYGNEKALPDAFIEWIRAMMDNEGRSSKQAMNRAREMFREGKAVPGYGTWREWFAATYPDRDLPKHFPGDYPRGWSQSNLYRYAPSKAQLVLARRGFGAAQALLEHVIRDTSTLRPLEFVAFDDFETDILARFYIPETREWKICRVAGVLAIDVATRRRLAIGLKPRIENDEGRKIGIARRDVQFLIKNLFARWGVPKDYPMTLLVENAAAAITPDFEAALELNFHGQVRVSRTGMIEHRGLKNGFTERGGKPWEKGWIESAFNLMHNRAGNLPGQKGSRYGLAPGNLAAKIAYTEGLLANISPEQASQLRLPFLSVDEAITAFEQVFDWMDQRTDHKLLGFDKVTECRVREGDAWQPFEQLALMAPEQQMQVALRDRMQSPLERWAKLATTCDFIKVPEFVVALLAFTPKRVEVRNHKITFTQGGTGFTYLDVDGALKTLPEGTKLFAYFDEDQPGLLYVTDMQGRSLAALKHNAPANLKDPEAMSAAAAIVKEHFHGQVQGPYRARHAFDEVRLAADHAHNATQVALFRPEPAEQPKRLTLSQTLAADTLTTPPEQRFAAAAETAAGIAAGATAQADERRRRDSTRKPKGDLGSLVEQPTQTGAAPDLSKLL